MVQMCIGILLLSFLIFVHLLLRLRTLFVETTEMRESLLFYFLVIVFAVIVKLSLFLVMHLLLQLHIPIVKRPKIGG